jgi:type VI secretion system protein ImpM
MPRSSVGAYQVASFWLSLIAPFLLNNDFELTLYYGNIGGKPRLAVGLLGADSHELASLMSTPNAIAERFINLDEALWVDQLIANNSEKAKLSSYLRQDRLSLRTLYNTFRQIYLNESQ